MHHLIEPLIGVAFNRYAFRLHTFYQPKHSPIERRYNYVFYQVAWHSSTWLSFLCWEQTHPGAETRTTWLLRSLRYHPYIDVHSILCNYIYPKDSVYRAILKLFTKREIHLLVLWLTVDIVNNGHEHFFCIYHLSREFLNRLLRYPDLTTGPIYVAHLRTWSKVDHLLCGQDSYCCIVVVTLLRTGLKTF